MYPCLWVLQIRSFWLRKRHVEIIRCLMIWFALLTKYTTVSLSDGKADGVQVFQNRDGLGAAIAKNGLAILHEKPAVLADKALQAILYVRNGLRGDKSSVIQKDQLFRLPPIRPGNRFPHQLYRFC